MKRVIIIVLILVLALTGCRQLVDTSATDERYSGVLERLESTEEPPEDMQDMPNTFTDEDTTNNINNKETESDPLTSTSEATIEPTVTPEPVNDSQIKYIFIVIADGMGEGQTLLGQIYARIEGESMDNGAVWESWPQQKYVEGRWESACGGTAIATGYVTNLSAIGMTPDKEHLVTIMDRAKEAGMSTGVVTNSSLVDATPAAFYSHNAYRMNFQSIQDDLPTGNIDYFAGGGMNDIVSISRAINYDKRDASSFETTPKYEYTSLVTLEDMGYATYIGYNDAIEYLDLVEQNEFKEEKSINIFSGSVMPYETYKMKPSRAESLQYVPSLIDMTEAGIQTLSQNPNGFCMMIEEASTDKTGHNRLQRSTVAQVTLLNDTLKLLMEFYEEHPDETLIVLTADHECGGYVWDMDQYNEWLTKADFKYNKYGDNLAKFLKDEWGVIMNDYDLQEYIDIYREGYWDTERENIANLYNRIAYETSLAIGIERTLDVHSEQQVPCYSIGPDCEKLNSSEGIEDIPIIISEIMGWEALPEIMTE